MKVVFCGQFTDTCGYGSAARTYLEAFDAYDIREKTSFFIYNVSFETTNGIFLNEKEKYLIDKYHLDNNELQNLLTNKDYVLINFQVPHIPKQIMLNKHIKPEYEKLLSNAHKNITMVVWETDTVPEIWKKCVFENVIVPCNWNNHVFTNQTKSKVFLLPYPVKSEKIKQNKKTNVFNILSISQWIPRKGFDTLLKAYYAEFFNDDDVCLTIKTYRNEVINNNKEEEKNHIINDIKKYKSLINDYDKSSNAKIKLVTDIITKDQINNLYDEADVFCLPTRGEGFGLTIAQAASKGVPCIVPDKGGHIDYLDKDNNFLYNSYYSMVMECSSLYSSKSMKYVESNIDDLRLNMRKAYNLWKQDGDILYDMGKKSKNFIDNYLDNDNIKKQFLNIIQEVLNNE